MTERSADKLITKRLSIYTNVDIAKKKLKMAVEVVGTCTSTKIDPHSFIQDHFYAYACRITTFGTLAHYSMEGMHIYDVASSLYSRYVSRLLGSSLIVSSIPFLPAWQELLLEPILDTIRHDLCWYNKCVMHRSGLYILTISNPRAGFCVLEEQNDSTLKPGDMSAIVEVRIRPSILLLRGR